jgi:hypothetical protein
MNKNYPHDNKRFNENKDKKKLSQNLNIKSKDVVDINILLNRVKIEKKNEAKRKIIFFSIMSLVLSAFFIFIFKN